MANDNDSVDSNGNSTDLRPRRSNRAKGKPIQQMEETDENVVIHNNVVYKIGDFVYYLDKKQDIYRIGLIEEFKHQKRDKLVNKRPEISLKQFYRLDEIPSSVLSNQGEYDTHVMPPNFPEWLRQRELFISDNALSTSCSSLRSLCTVRHFPDLNHAMALFSSAQSSGQVTNSSPRVDHHPIITGNKDNSCIPVPKQRDDNTFFYVYSYNARGRKLAATYLEIRVGPAYQVELPDWRPVEEQQSDPRYVPCAWEQLMWKPNQIPEEVFNMYNQATVSIACFSAFGGGVDDSASVENGRKISLHMLTGQRVLDCLHRSQYVTEKAVETFAENALPETSKMPFLWTDEDHVLFDESVKIHGKNFLRIKQDKRNKKGRLVGDYVTFYYYWKKNRPKNRKYATKKNLRSRASVATVAAVEGAGEAAEVKREAVVPGGEDGGGRSPEVPAEAGDPSPGDSASTECCLNCKLPLPKPEEEALSASEAERAPLSERMKSLCYKCQHYLRRYGYQKPVELASADKVKGSEDEDEAGDFEDGTNGFEDEEEEDEAEGEDDEEDDVFPAVVGAGSLPGPLSGSPVGPALVKEEETVKPSLAINKYDFDEEDENVEEVASLLKKSHQAKHHHHHQRQPQAVPPEGKVAVASGKGSTSAAGGYKAGRVGAKGAGGRARVPGDRVPGKRAGGARAGPEGGKRRRVEAGSAAAASRQIHESLKAAMATQPPAPPAATHYDSRSSSSSSSSSSTSSNDSSSDSGDDADSAPLAKRTAVTLATEGPVGKEPPRRTETAEAAAAGQGGQTGQAADTSYNQMITCVPNIPGVCAVTNVGEPMPQLTQNLSTDLSAPPSSSGAVSMERLHLTVAEPLYKQLSLGRPAETVAKDNGTVTKFVNFTAIGAVSRGDQGNPEETGLNLVKPKKGEHAWAPPHDQPSRMVHHRGDDGPAPAPGTAAPVPAQEAPRQTLNDHEVVHNSQFGHVVRVLRCAESCARTDLQHTTAGLRAADLEWQRAFIGQQRAAEAQTAAQAQSATAQAQAGREGDQGRRAMPPPACGEGKGLVHHQAARPPPGPPQAALAAHQRKPQTAASASAGAPGPSLASQGHGPRAQSPRQPQGPSAAAASSAASSSAGGLLRPGQHLHQRQGGLHMQAPPPGMQPVGNTTLLADYNNMNKVTMNELLFLQHQQQPSQSSYEQPDVQKLLMMYNLPMRAPPPPQIQQQQQQQWDRGFGAPLDGWGGGLSLGGGQEHLQALLRLLQGQAAPPQQGQGQQPLGGHGRPRSAAGLNLSNGGCEKSGRASANHGAEYGGGAAADSPEMLERLLVAEQMYQSLVTGMQKQQGGGPPVAHGFVPGFPGVPPHLGLPPPPAALLSQMQGKPAPLPPPPQPFPGSTAAQRQAFNEMFQLYMNGFGLNPSR